MRSEIKLLTIGLTGAVLLGFVAINLLGSQQYMRVSSLKKLQMTNIEVAVIGRIVNGSITFEDNTISFIIFDDESPNKESIKVVYIGGENIAVHDGIIVVVKGIYNGEVILAKEVLTKCPSTYKPSEAG